MTSNSPQQLLAAFIAIAVAMFCSTAAKADPARACVWKIQNGNATVYLAGSVHLLREDDHPLPPPYEMAYEACQKLYFEVDMSEMMAGAGKALEDSKLPNGDTIEDHVSEETYKKLKAYFKKRGIGGKMLESMKPGMLAVTISGIEAMQMGAMPQFGVEMFFNVKATADDKPVTGLETVEFQMGMFDSMEPGEQDDFLAITLDEVDKTPEVLGELIDVWKQGDIEKLNDLLNDQFEEGDKLTELLLYSRNKNWIPAIEKELKSDGVTLIIVGAAHLVGKGSVIDLLEKKGHEAVQLTYED